jgi:hypothetical protein
MSDDKFSDLLLRTYFLYIISAVVSDSVNCYCSSARRTVARGILSNPPSHIITIEALRYISVIIAA